MLGWGKAFSAESDVLRYILKDKKAEGDAEIMKDEDVLVAVGSKLAPGELAGFLGEKLTGFNKNLWIHDKFMLVDPLGTDPVVVTGSANFSKGSQTSNDENRLVIRGDARAARIYFTEFMRVFDHIYARWMIRRVRDADLAARNFLEDDASWTKRHEGTASARAKRRRYFAGTI
jgi:phosphatidylserine/phosphatidylglycerophosphate/cardiolipin synthase-like enzyme